MWQITIFICNKDSIDQDSCIKKLFLEHFSFFAFYRETKIYFTRILKRSDEKIK